MTGTAEDTAQMQALPPARAAEIQQAQAAMPSDHADIIHALGTAVETLWPYAKGFLKATLWPAGMQRQWQLEDEQRHLQQANTSEQSTFANIADFANRMRGGGGGASSPAPEAPQLPASLIGTPAIQAAAANPAYAPEYPQPGAYAVGRTDTPTATESPSATPSAGPSRRDPAGLVKSSTPESAYVAALPPGSSAGGAPPTSAASLPTSPSQSSAVGVPGQQPGVFKVPSSLSVIPPRASTVGASSPSANFGYSMTLPLGKPGEGSVTVRGGADKSPTAADRRLDLETSYWNDAASRIAYYQQQGLSPNEATQLGLLDAHKATGYLPDRVRGLLTRMGVEPTLLEHEQNVAGIRAAGAGAATTARTEALHETPAKAVDAMSTANEMFSAIENLAGLFNPKVTGPMQGRVTKAIDLFGGNKPETSQFLAATKRLQVAFRKATTGAQASYAELRYLNAVLPRPEDAPTVWQAKWRELAKEFQRTVDAKSQAYADAHYANIPSVQRGPITTFELSRMQHQPAAPSTPPAPAAPTGPGSPLTGRVEAAPPPSSVYDLIDQATKGQ